jgi:stearoyl-CoA desaturase (delta-9 desaturase)
VRWSYLLSISAVHLIAMLAVFPWFFSWPAAITAAVGVVVFGQGINLCYHRVLTHRSARLALPVERFFVFLALCCLEDTPAKWVTIHRLHHRNSDQPDDPHSPLHRPRLLGALWAHAGWLFMHNAETHSLSASLEYAHDVLEDPFYRKLEKGLLWLQIYILHVVGLFLIGCGVGWAVEGTAAGALQAGASWLVWAAALRTVAVWHITWTVNSLSHLFGYRNYETTDDSRNNWLVAVFAMGEGWHNNHHHDPVSATNQHRWWEIDATYYVLWTLQKLGLATNVIMPRATRHAGRRREALAIPVVETAGAELSHVKSKSLLVDHDKAPGGEAA